MNNHANLSFGQAPQEDPSGFAKRAEAMYRLDENGHLIHAVTGEPVSLVEEQKRIAEEALETSAKKHRTDLGSEIARVMMQEHHPHLHSDPMNSRISVSKQDLYDLIIEASVRSQKAVGR